MLCFFFDEKKIEKTKYNNITTEFSKNKKKDLKVFNKKQN